ncbi:MAG: sugar transferase [Candidatus Nomurabacteria bacterium]|jgi:O-antigen biosynthesis protein WbqP|nr:sugar transferase [Candidatus Nomurabacteria bacterium]
MKKPEYPQIKRAGDFIFALLGLAILAAPFFLVALIIKLESDGPAIRRDKRIGKNGKHFIMYKFRTMTMNAPICATAHCDHSKYVTRFGSILRKSSFDELPQLVNVLRGEMSLIGPRPVIALEKTTNSLRQKHRVFAIRPGITGWAQVNGRDNVDEVEKVALDRHYRDHLSFKMDCACVIRTFTTVLIGDGIAENTKETVKINAKKD